MSMNAGDENVAAGTMARAIYDALEGAFGVAPDAEQDGNRKKAAAAIAQGVVAHLANYAEATVTVTTSDGGLQTSTAAGNPTGAPASDVAISGFIS